MLYHRSLQAEVQNPNVEIVFLFHCLEISPSISDPGTFGYEKKENVRSLSHTIYKTKLLVGL